MNFLDMRTVVSSYVVSNLICLIVMIFLWVRNRRRFEGIGFWVADFALQFVAMLIVTLRGVLPDLVAMTIGNTMLLGGAILLYAGLLRFTRRRGTLIHLFVLLAAFVVVHAYFVVVSPSLAVRNIIFSAALCAVCAQSAWLMLVRSGQAMRPVTLGVGAVFVAFAVVSLARIVFDLASPPGNDFFHSGIFDTIVLLVYQMCYIVLTFSLSLMLNTRLFGELERDIARRERAEKILRIRLVLWEYAAGHTVKELMQQALDEIEGLTGSLIGFYHFADEAAGTLTLQAWSTRTRATYCKAEGEGSHYPLAQAGVWADCVRERRPIIHNDYASLANRRGMPPGHAALVRELVVPTMRDGRVVSVLGVGNKADVYDEDDIVLVSYVADLVWTIVSQKRAEEEILRLNGRLRHQANTDELTGLANRRRFFAIGAEEIRRCRRYAHPLALIMIDLDNFKHVNDSYGHDAGDRVLFCVAKTLLANIRDVDTAARLGGEEFGVLLPNTRAEDAVSLAERLRLAIDATACHPDFSGANVTASLGVAAWDERTPGIDAFLKRADIAMYQAKREGRNRVCFIE
jgi:diguanylate cyclase (GGDEF)-like protein